MGTSFSSNARCPDCFGRLEVPGAQLGDSRDSGTKGPAACGAFVRLSNCPKWPDSRRWCCGLRSGSTGSAVDLPVSGARVDEDAEVSTSSFRGNREARSCTVVWVKDTNCVLPSGSCVPEVGRITSAETAGPGERYTLSLAMCAGDCEGGSNCTPCNFPGEDPDIRL